MDRETRLGLIAASILEGTPVDWPAVASSASPEDETVLRQLRLLEEVTALHRGTGTAKTATADDTRGLAMWGHLRLLEQVGRGSFGEVYRAWDTHLDREVALKLLRARPAPHDPSASLSDPARVVHEGRLLARVRHPHVITVYGAEPRDGTVGIWMEFIRGTTLHRLVEQQGRLGAREAAAIGTDLCRALAAVHRAGLLHRDISARNVMREEGGRVVLMDFGAGRDDRVEQTSGGGLTGTPLYMAPELFTGRAADQRSDIYALGTLLFYLVTGRYPVAGRSLEEVREAHRRGERARLRDLRADVPAAFVRAIEQAIDPDPRQRFLTVGEMEAALDRLPTGDVVSPATARGRWLTAAAAVGVGVGVAGFLSLRSPDDTAASSRQPGEPATAPSGLVARRIEPPEGVWPFSNPSDDGRFVAGMVTETGDVAIVDMVTGDYWALGVGGGTRKGYASLGALSPDGTTVAVDWHDDRGGSLHVVRTDGSRPRVLIEAPGDVTPYQWSRDGRLILALVQRPDQPNVIGLVAASDGAVREVKQIGETVPDRMSLSPDGRYIAYDAATSTGDDSRDIFILDAHTGNQWRFEPSPTDEHAPFWTPDGQGLVFLSDRNRNASLWQAPVENGRLQGTPQLLKDDVGRVWLRGFTAAGAMHYQLYAGFAEVYLASIDGPTPRPEPLSPRRAVSNFYPVWSPDGRFVAYASERSSLDAARAGRELWIYDATTGTEVVVPVGEAIGRPVAWSADSREILVVGPRLLIVERSTGRARVIATEFEPRTAWGPAGVIFQRRGQFLLVDPGTGRTLRTLGPARDLKVAPDGRSVVSLRPGGRVELADPASGRAREWQDSGIEWLGNHYMAPHAPAVAYEASRKSVNGDVKTLMYWGGGGEPRELLRVSAPEQFILAGWLPDGLNLLVTRWAVEPTSGRSPSTLWRVPITGGPPVSTGLTMDGLRDNSIHPAGRRIAFNAGWKRGEQWVMENLLPR